MIKYLIYIIIWLHFTSICQSQVENSTILYIQDCNNDFQLDSIPILQNIYYNDSIVSSDVYIGATVLVPHNTTIYYIGFGDTIRYQPNRKMDTLCLMFEDQGFSKKAIIKAKQPTFKEILISFLNDIAVENRNKYKVEFDQLMYSVENSLLVEDSIYKRIDTILIDPYKNIFGKGITLGILSNKSKEEVIKINISKYYPLPNYNEIISILIFHDIDKLIKEIDKGDVYVAGTRKMNKGFTNYTFKVKNLTHIFGDELVFNIVDKSDNLYIQNIKCIITYNYKDNDPKYFFEKRFINATYDPSVKGHYPKKVKILVISEDSNNSHFEKLFTTFKLIKNNFGIGADDLKGLLLYDKAIGNWIKSNLNIE